jgi:cobalamin biosynthesis Mg chelatase CobN
MATDTSFTLSFPVPASARVHPTTSSRSANTIAPAKVVGPATTTVPATAGTPTTTYVPSGATPLPGIPSTGAGAGATPSTTATPFKSALNAHALTRARSKHSDTSTGAIALAVVAALLVLACLGWALARRRAFEPHWLLSLRHAIAEAGFRVSATWAEFTDWARLGR